MLHDLLKKQKENQRPALSKKPGPKNKMGYYSGRKRPAHSPEFFQASRPTPYMMRERSPIHDALLEFGHLSTPEVLDYTYTAVKRCCPLLPLQNYGAIFCLPCQCDPDKIFAQKAKIQDRRQNEEIMHTHLEKTAGHQNLAFESGDSGQNILHV